MPLSPPYVSLAATVPPTAKMLLGCGKPEPGERPRGAGPARWEDAGPLVAGCPGRSASLPPRTADRAVESNSGVITATELRKDCRSHPELGHLWEVLAFSPAVQGEGVLASPALASSSAAAALA